MTENEVTATIVGLVRDAFEALDPPVPYCTENQAFDPAVDAEGSPYWSRVTLQFLRSERRSIGRPARVRRSGNVFVQLFVPEGKGTGDRPDDTAGLDTLSAAVRGALELVSDGDLDLETAQQRGKRSDPPWFTTTVVIPFAYIDHV